MADLFGDLPFKEAVDALVRRLAMRKEDFLSLTAGERSKAFTVAYVADEGILEEVHHELTDAIRGGDTFRDFQQRLERLKERSGWTGTEPGHYQRVFEENAAQSYTSGRVRQITETGIYEDVLPPGEFFFRYLPSIADVPRIEHEEYYNNIYRWRPGTPLPPLDFGCACGWEIVFPEELEDMGIDAARVPVFEPKFRADQQYRFVPVF